jgi:hypothetical protein
MIKAIDHQEINPVIAPIHRRWEGGTPLPWRGGGSLASRHSGGGNFRFDKGVENRIRNDRHGENSQITSLTLAKPGQSLPIHQQIHT